MSRDSSCIQCLLMNESILAASYKYCCRLYYSFSYSANIFRGKFCFQSKSFLNVLYLRATQRDFVISSYRCLAHTRPNFHKSTLPLSLALCLIVGCGIKYSPTLDNKMTLVPSVSYRFLVHGQLPHHGTENHPHLGTAGCLHHKHSTVTFEVHSTS